MDLVFASRAFDGFQRRLLAHADAESEGLFAAVGYTNCRNEQYRTDVIELAYTTRS